MTHRTRAVFPPPSPPVGGHADPTYALTGDVFTRLLTEGPETGAAVAVVHDGRLVLDLYGGWQDDTAAWSTQTLAPLFCLGKPIAALAVLSLVSRGRIDLDMPVGAYWPAFAASGKDQILVRHLLSHTAGLPAFPVPRSTGHIPDWETLVADLAAARPEWPVPGITMAEHAFTFGHLLGELVRRVDGRPLDVFLAEEIAGPHGLDIALRLTAAQAVRAVDVRHADTDWLPRTVGPAYTLRHRALDNPTGLLDPVVLNTDWCRAAPLPAVNIHATAVAVARLFAGVLRGGHGLIAAEYARAMSQVQARGYDLVLDQPVARGLGVTVGPDGSWGMAAIGGNLLNIHPGTGQVFVYLSQRLADDAAATTMLRAVRACAATASCPGMV
ncbi:serine hydrolase domain-containing protein [Actinomycetes bacterium KLBMP 9797]